MIGGVALAVAVAAILAGERLRPRRPRTQAEPARTGRNLAMGAMSMAVVAVLERPVTARLAARAEAGRRGLVQKLPLPRLARDAAAVLLMDYTIYLWHVATHRVPWLWRLHLVHHVDLDLDASTALRFHAADMAVSAPYRAAQVALIGASPRALAVWRAWFFASVLFHHSNLRLGPAWERRLSRLLTTPGMHDVHHSASPERAGSNWSSGFSLWDRLHGTFRAPEPAPERAIGVAAYRDEADTRLSAALAMPFMRQRDAWGPAPGAERFPAQPNHEETSA